MQEKKFLSVRETCTYLNISRFTLYRWFEKGILKKRKIGGRVFIIRSEVDELLEGAQK